ncbi:MAG: N-acetylmuramoyl-L-alanine amidase [bacterium]|nr:N-acetylmuramoyl-L-alanine amidase [bacterium]
MKKYAAFFFALLLLFCDPLGVLCQEAAAKSNIVIVIDPGHGGPGTTDEQELGAKYNGVLEKDLTLITATAMKNELEQYGNVTVYLTRSTDQPMTLAARSLFAASVGADALISIHYNASAEHNFYGAEVFTSAFGQHYATGKGLGSCMLKQLCASGAADKGCKTRIGKSGTDYYGIIRHGVNNHVPTIIVEHGYIDNGTDWNRIGQASAWQQLGIGDAAAVAQYYGLQKGLTQVDVSPTVNVAVPSETMMPDLTPPTNVTVNIDGTNAADHTVTYTVTASEPESKLMYCTYSTDGGLTYAPLSLWGSQKSHTETVSVPAGNAVNMLVRVYNNYELDTVSTPVAVKMDAGKTTAEKSEGASAAGQDAVGSQSGTAGQTADQSAADSQTAANQSTADLGATGGQNGTTGSGAADGQNDKTSSETAGDQNDVSDQETDSADALWGDQLENVVNEQTAASQPASEAVTGSVMPAWKISAIVVGALLLGVILTTIGIVYTREKRHRKRRKKR